MYLKTQKFLVLGASRSGIAVCKYLLENDAICFVYDDVQSNKIENAIKELEIMGATKVNKEEAINLISEIDVLVLSPGVPINHELAVSAKKANKRIVGELEFGFSVFNPCIVGVTGTNGKTTTVSMINWILSNSGIENKLVGNVGNPITSCVKEIKTDTVCVTEVSSFQLESINAFCPHIACVLNISPDHLERHYSMENYIFLKKRILKNQTASEYAVLNYDDETVKSFAEDIRAKPIWVSLYQAVNGAYLDGDDIKFQGAFVLNKKELPVFGDHNVYNALFSVAVCKLLGVPNDAIREGLRTFKGVKHRLEFVLTKNGIKFYNDSKSTNTSSTISAINAIRETKVLILGGSEKGETYKDLFDEIKKLNVKHVVLTGASRLNMMTSAVETGFTDMSVVGDFKTAIKVAEAFATSGDVVLFSPACASFDNFRSYEERGLAFIKAVEELS